MISNNFDSLRLGQQQIYAENMKSAPPPVGMALDELEKELHNLRELTQRLGQRLTPVMRPVPEEGAKGLMGRTGGGSQLANQIESLAQLTRYTSAEIAALLDCLEI
jgi:hypothetical protein